MKKKLKLRVVSICCVAALSITSMPAMVASAATLEATDVAVTAASVLKGSLLNSINTAKAKVASDFTKSSYAAMLVKLNAAQAVYDNANATQQQVDTAKNELDAAVKAMVVVSVLQSIIDTGDKMWANGEFDKTHPVVVDGFLKSLAASKAMITEGTATQAEVNAQTVDLLGWIHKVDWTEADFQ